jgi:hypothetical protein
MSTIPQSKAARVLRQLEEAQQYLDELVKLQALPVTPEELRAEFDVTRERMKDMAGASIAMVLAIIEDHPVPVSAFKMWASARTIARWRQAETSPLAWVELNGKVCVTPSDFFRALRQHGSKSP